MAAALHEFAATSAQLTAYNLPGAATMILGLQMLAEAVRIDG